MGNRIAKMTSASTDANTTPTLQVEIPSLVTNRYMDDCDASQYSGLTADAASDIALRWLNTITAHVSIDFTMSDSDSSLSLAFDRVWFKIMTPAHAREAAAIVRATAMVWCLLAQCRGYGVDENPEFWRRIFATVYSPGRAFSNMLKFVTPSSALVPGPVALHPRDCGTAFPRIGVLLYNTQSPQLGMEVWRIFCGVDEYFYQNVQRVLDEVLTQLIPHLHSNKRPVVDVAFCMTARSDVVPSPSELNQVRQSPLAPLFHVSSVVETKDHQSERARVAVINANRRELVRPRSPKELDPFVTIDEPVPVEWYRSSSVRYDEVMALCASLPHTRSSLTSLHYVDTQRFNNEQWELPWIRYAIFHPDAMNSSLTKLTVQLSETRLSWLTHAGIPNYRAEGNGASWSPSESRYPVRYFRVLLAAGTAIRTSPDPKITPILTLSARTYADLLPDNTPRGGTRWRNVVVRSIGSCWVTTDDIVGPIERRPRLKSPCIRDLTVVIGTRTFYYTRYQDNLADRVLQLSGNLIRLHIETLGRFTRSQLNRILKANPQLKSLSIENDGSLWRDEGVVWRRRTKWPRLEELKLLIRTNVKPGARYFAPSEVSITTGSLCNLRNFVAIIESESIFDASQRDFAWLINTHPKLSYVVISPTNTNLQQPVRDYVQWKYVSEQRLLAAGVNGSVVMGRRDRSAKVVALMSVVYRLQQQQQCVSGGALASFGSDVMECVLSFVGNGDARVVWFGPWMN